MEASILRRLRDLTDFEVADDNPDVRGWSVRGSDGQALGMVHELIVDPDAPESALPRRGAGCALPH